MNEVILVSYHSSYPKLRFSIPIGILVRYLACHKERFLSERTKEPDFLRRNQVKTRSSLLLLFLHQTLITKKTPANQL